MHILPFLSRDDNQVNVTFHVLMLILELIAWQVGGIFIIR